MLFTLPESDEFEMAKVSFIYVEEEDEVSKGEAIIELVTDKATFDVPSPINGVIDSLYVSEDDKIKPGDRICEIV